mmetsp:Transcript_2464/g.5648  ORF Transcript_2464/g.5648 Transcript_2464/m.5648 type:complete len:254 (-) Transcript_2464:700-1461(-)
MRKKGTDEMEQIARKNMTSSNSIFPAGASSTSCNAAPPRVMAAGRASALDPRPGASLPFWTLLIILRGQMTPEKLALCASLAGGGAPSPPAPRSSLSFWSAPSSWTCFCRAAYIFSRSISEMCANTSSARSKSSPFTASSSCTCSSLSSSLATHLSSARLTSMEFWRVESILLLSASTSRGCSASRACAARLKSSSATASSSSASKRPRGSSCRLSLNTASACFALATRDITSLTIQRKSRRFSRLGTTGDTL